MAAVIDAAVVDAGGLERGFPVAVAELLRVDVAAARGREQQRIRPLKLPLDQAPWHRDRPRQEPPPKPTCGVELTKYTATCHLDPKLGGDHRQATLRTRTELKGPVR